MSESPSLIPCLIIAALSAAHPLVASDLNEVPCEPFPSLEMKMAGEVYEAATKEKRFDITWSSDRPDSLGTVDADGWRTEDAEHVANRCFRYYAATTGRRGADLDDAIRMLREANALWIEEMITTVVNDSERQGEGRALGMFYGQYRLACEAQIDAGQAPFVVP